MSLRYYDYHRTVKAPCNEVREHSRTANESSDSTAAGTVLRFTREFNHGKTVIVRRRAAGWHRRVRFTFQFQGIRYRPTLPWIPTEANLRRARQHMLGIGARIACGAFQFAEEFPDFRHLKIVPLAGSPRICHQVFDDYLAHCAARVARHDMAPVTLICHRKVLDGIWRPELGPLRFLDIRYSQLVQIADRAEWGKKTYSNVLSVPRRAFNFGYRDNPERHDPTRELKGARIQYKGPAIDPFAIEEAETLIQALRREWGDAQANYDEFRFFTGLRPSEQISQLVSDYDAVRGTLEVTKARVNGTDEDSTKTGEDRRVVLCSRAIGALKRHLALREKLVRTCKIDHACLFFKAGGQRLRNLQYPGMRWQQTLSRLKDVRYRRPYVARQHGHSISTMLRFYAAGADGAPESDVERIRATLNSERALRSTPASVRPRRLSRLIARPFEMELPADRNASQARFATRFATDRVGLTAKSRNEREKTGGEKDSRRLPID